MAEKKQWEDMSKNEQRAELVRRIKNAIYLDIHSSVCYLLNFCDLPQETATELSVHYNAINETIADWFKGVNYV